MPGLLVLFLLLPLFAASSALGLSLEQIGVFAKPIYVTSDPDDAGRLFVVEREGAIKLIEDGTVSTYIDLTDEVACCAGERGLFSIAFDPDFATNRKLYVAYTSKGNIEGDEGDIAVEEVTAPEEPTDPEEPEGPFVLRPVLLIPHSQFNIHNGGQLQFGPDGYLYLSTGDGGHFDPREAPQDIESALGKILRFDPEPSVTLDYTPPPDNPFAGGSGLAPIVWALGLRNPFRFSFDRLSGDLVIGDVGEGAREEVDWAPSPAPGVVGGAGDNYGWSCREGMLPGLGASDPFCAGKGAADFDSPVLEYDHVDPNATGAICSGSIIGGYVVRDPALGALNGRYVYADYCTGEVRSLQLPSAPGGLASDDCPLGLPFNRPTSFGEDAAGKLYIASNAGGVYRIAGPAFEGCSPQVEPNKIFSNPAPLSPEATPVLLRLRISAQRRPGGPFLISVTVAPCTGAGGTVLLLRGGKPNGKKGLGADCIARFRRGVSKRSTFRAQLVPQAGEPTVRSRRLTLGAQ